MQGAQVQSLVREPRPCMLHGTAKKKKVLCQILNYFQEFCDEPLWVQIFVLMSGFIHSFPLHEFLQVEFSDNVLQFTPCQAWHGTMYLTSSQDWVLSALKVISNLVLTCLILISISLLLVDLNIFLVRSLAIFPKEGYSFLNLKGRMRGRHCSRREQWGSTLNSICFHPWRFLLFPAWEKEKLRKSSLGARTAEVTSAMSQPEAHKVNVLKTQL